MNTHANHRCAIGLRRQAGVEPREKAADGWSPMSLGRVLFAIRCIHTSDAFGLA